MSEWEGEEEEVGKERGMDVSHSILRKAADVKVVVRVCTHV